MPVEQIISILFFVIIGSYLLYIWQTQRSETNNGI